MKLLGVENSGGIVEKTWLHTGDNGQDVITTETIQDVEPIIKRVKNLAGHRRGKDMHHIAEIPSNLVNDSCYKLAKIWGISASEVFAELMNSNTDRAKDVWRTFTKSRDYCKLQSKHYEP